jgi:hypothetical protein
MTPGEKLGWLANLERCKAQKTIHEGNFEPTDYRGVYSLYLLAHDDVRLAEKAQARALEAYVDQECDRARRR